MHIVPLILALLSVGALAVYLSMITQRSAAVSAYRHFLLALATLLVGESILRLSDPGGHTFLIALRLIYYPGQVFLFITACRFATVYPFHRPLPAWASILTFVLGGFFSVWPFLIAPDTTVLLTGRHGFVHPFLLDKAVFGSTLAAFKDLFLFLLAATALARLTWNHLMADQARVKNHLRYLLLSVAGPLLLGGGTDLWLPWLLPEHPPYPLMSVGAILCALVFSYAMTTHQVLDLRLVVKNSLLYSILTAVISFLYLALAEVSTFLVQFVIPKATLMVSYLFVLAMLLLVAPLRNKIQWFLDSYIFRDKYQYQHVLEELFRVIPFVHDRNRLIPAVLDLIRKHFRARTLALVAPGETPPVTILDSGSGYRTLPHAPFSDKSRLFRWFNTDNPGCGHLLINPAASSESSEYLELLDEASLLGDVNPTVVLPLSCDGVIGVLFLGDREGGRLYSADDLMVLETIVQEFAVCLERLRAMDQRTRERLDGLQKHESARRQGSMKDTLRILRRLREGFDKNRKRSELRDMVAQEEERLAKELEGKT